MTILKLSRNKILDTRNVKGRLHCLGTGADPGFDQRGGPYRDRPKLPTVCSSIAQAKRALFSVGSGAHLRAPEGLGYFITKYAFSPFRVFFLYYF